jgi:hypothetical protein
VPHYVILSPLESPITYALFVMTWLSCVIGIWVSIYFYRAKSGTWWLLIAAALAFPLITEITICLLHGLPPLPYALVYPEQKYPPAPLGPDDWQQPGMPRTTGTIIIRASRAQWSFYPPLMAVALGWAYLADRKKRNGGVSR